MMNRIDRCHALMGQMTRWLCVVSGLVMLVVMVLGTCIDIVTRNFGAGIPGIWEAVTLAMRCMIGLALPFSFYYGSHIAVEYFTDLFSRSWRQLMIVISALVTLLMVTLLAWKIVDRMLAVKGYGGLTSDLSIPVYLEWLALAIGPILSMPVLISVLVRELQSLCGCDESTEGKSS